MKAMYEFMLRNAKLSAAYTRVRAWEVWPLVVVEMWGRHVVLHRHRQTSRHVYSSTNSSTVLAAIPAVSNGWSHTSRLIVAFPA